MSGPDAARSPQILVKRIQRLLRLDRGSRDQSEISTAILPLLRSLGSVALIGGAIRDVARAGRRGFSSDLDFVIYGSDRSDFVVEMKRRDAIRNKFGGYALRGFRWKVDVWHLEDTWAKTAGLVDVKAPVDLLRCTFFDWDSIIYEIDANRLLLPEDYLERLQSNVMDIRLEDNPNQSGSLVRALRRAAGWRVQFGPRLTAFSKNYLRKIPWADLVSLDARAFYHPMLQHLDKTSILERLDAPTQSPAGEVTLPVPEWDPQLKLRLGNETTSLSARMETNLSPAPYAMPLGFDGITQASRGLDHPLRDTSSRAPAELPAAADGTSHG